MLYCQYGWKLGAYEDTALDNIIKSVTRRAGIDESLVSNHVLRRSGACMIIYSGVPIEEISSMLGHAYTRTTMIYLGLTVEVIAKAQAKRDDYLGTVRMKLKEHPEAVESMVRPTLFKR